jgi:hypothetical protein
MAFIAARQALSVSPPVISATTVSNVAISIALITPSFEPVTGIAYYQLYRVGPLGGGYTLIQPNLTSFPYIDSGLSAGEQYSYYLRGVDNSSQADISAPSAIVTATTAGAPANAKKWNAFIRTQGGGFGRGGSANNQFSTRNNTYYQKDPSDVRHYLLTLYWNQIEPTYNNYTNAAFIQDVNALANLGKYLIIKIHTYTGGSGPSTSLPSYIYSSTDPNYVSGYGTGYYASDAAGNAMWRVRGDLLPIMQRKWAMHQYLAQTMPIPVTIGGNTITYVGADSCQWIIMVIDDEETQPSNLGNCLPNGYGASALNSNLANWFANYNSSCAHLGGIWQQTNVGIPFNFTLGSSDAVTIAQIKAMSAAIASNACCWCPPDIIPNQTSVLSGVTYNGTNGVVGYTGQLPGTSSYQGIVPWLAQVEGDDEAGQPFNSTYAQIFGYLNNVPESGNNTQWPIYPGIINWGITPTNTPVGSPPGTGSNWTGDIVFEIGQGQNQLAVINGVYPSGYPS